MGQITGGRVVYGRTVQPAQYESKKAEVEIAFVLSEDEDYEELLDKAILVAQTKAHEMVGLATSPLKSNKYVAVTDLSEKISNENEVAKPPRGRGRPPKVEPEPIVEAPTEITDRDLTLAVTDCVNRTKNQNAIRELRATFVSSGGIRDIPQEKRAEFIEKLKDIKSLKPNYEGFP